MSLSSIGRGGKSGSAHEARKTKTRNKPNGLTTDVRHSLREMGTKRCLTKSREMHSEGLWVEDKKGGNGGLREGLSGFPVLKG